MPKRSAEYMEGQRRRFCEAAIVCFGRTGVTRTSLTDICAETGLSMGALYKLFDSREDLLEAVLAYRLAWRNSLLHGETWQQLKAALLAYRAETARNPFWREFLGIVDWNERLSRVRTTQAEFIHAQVEGHLKRYASSGEISLPFDANQAAQLLGIIIDGSMTNARSATQLYVSDKDLGAYLDLAVGANEIKSVSARAKRRSNTTWN